MKRYIRCDTKLNILRKIESDLIAEGRNAQYCREHHCVNVFDDSGNIIEQHYAEETPKKLDQEKFRYRKALPGEKAEYVRVYYDSKVKDYTDIDHLVKYVSRTNKDRSER